MNEAVRELYALFGFKFDQSSARAVDSQVDKYKAKLATVSQVIINQLLLPVQLFARASVMAFAADEQQLLRFTTLLGGSTEEAKALNDQLDLMSLKEPIPVAEIKQGAEALLRFGFNASEAMESFAAMKDIAAGTQTPISQLAFALGRVKMFGALDSRSLRLFGQAMPAVVQGLQHVLGVGSEGVRKMLSKGEVSFAQVQRALQWTQQNRFLGASDRQLNTIAGALIRLNNAWAISKERFGAAINAAVPLAKILNVLATALEKLSKWASELNPALRHTLVIFTGLLAVVWPLATGWMFWGKNIALVIGLLPKLLGPISILTGLFILIEDFYQWYTGNPKTILGELLGPFAEWEKFFSEKWSITGLLTRLRQQLDKFFNDISADLELTFLGKVFKYLIVGPVSSAQGIMDKIFGAAGTATGEVDVLIESVKRTLKAQRSEKPIPQEIVNHVTVSVPATMSVTDPASAQALGDIVGRAAADALERQLRVAVGQGSP